MQILFVVLISLVGVLGDYILKLAGSGSKYVDVKLFVIGTIVYASTAVGWFFVLKHIKLGSLGLIYATTTIIALSIVGMVFFKESYTPYEITGLLLGLISIILLARFS